MDTQKKPTVVHFALVAMTMVSVVLAMTAYLFHKEKVQLNSEIQKLKQALARCEEQSRPAGLPNE